MRFTNFKSLSEEEQKKQIIDFAQDLYLTKERTIEVKDLEAFNISKLVVERLFKSMQNLCQIAGIPSKRRKQNMSDEDFKRHITSLPRNDSSDCPSIQLPGSLCYLRCTCWVTDKVCKGTTGRPYIGFKGKLYLLYRIVYLLFNGPIEDGLCICHLCDNPSCYNPDHLVKGTDKDNAKQRTERGRNNATGPKHPSHKLTDAYDSEGLLAWVKENSIISDRNEWLYPIAVGPGGYPRIGINKKVYQLARLLLAHKLGVKYEDIEIAGHKFPENLPYSDEVPKRNDVNPEHLYNTTHQQNTVDSHGYHKGCHLSRSDVILIFEEAKKINWLTTRAMDFDIRFAEILGVSAKTIRDVRVGKTYKSWHTEKSISAQKRSVIQMSKEKVFIARFESIVEAEKATNIRADGIQKVCSGVHKSAGGFLWVYELQA